MSYQELNEFAKMIPKDVESLYFELAQCSLNKLGRTYTRIMSKPFETEENISQEFIKARTPFPLIVGLGNVDLVKIMISNGVDVNVLAAGDFTALNMACYQGNRRMAEVLLQRKADPNKLDVLLRSPLMSLFHAINEKWFNVDLDECYRMTQLLVSYGAKLGPYDMETMTYAIKNANLDTVKFLMNEAGGNMRHRSPNTGDICLHSAVFAQQPGVMEYVFEAFKKFNMDQEQFPCTWGYKHRSDDSSFNHSSVTPLMKACHRDVQNHKAVKMLLKAGAKFYNSFELLIEGKHNSELAWLYYDLGFDVLNRENKNLLDKAVSLNSPWMEDIVAEIARRKMMGAQIVGKNQQVFEQCEKASCFLELCEQQLGEMQKIKFYKDVSFWDVLTADQNKLTEYAGKSELVEAFFKAKCDGLFPRYCARIRNRFFNYVPRNTLMDLSAYVVSETIKRPQMHEILQHEVMSHMEDDDFLKLLVCYCLEA